MRAQSAVMKSVVVTPRNANVVHYLKQDFSPEQIVGRAALEGKEMVSHERIYQYIWKDKRGGGSADLYLTQNIKNALAL